MRSGSMMFATRYGSTAGRSRPCAARRHRAAITFPTPIGTGTRAWPGSFSPKVPFDWLRALSLPKRLEHLQTLSPEFVRGPRGRGITRRFRRVIHLVDSTTIQLVASCMDWAKHRRRKAAAKCHLRLDLQSFLPRFVIIDTARDNDSKRAREVCAGIQPGEIVLFDKAYLDFEHLFALAMTGIHWVTRAKENLQYRVCKRLKKPGDRKILRDAPYRAQDARLARGLSRADAAGRGAGGSRWQGSGDGVLD